MWPWRTAPTHFSHRACLHPGCNRPAPSKRPATTTALSSKPRSKICRLRSHQCGRDALQCWCGQCQNSGNFVYFDNATHVIGPEHVMASCALPHGFPPVEIEGECYGGIVSNTPLQWVLESEPRQDTLAFQVDLWSARGAIPRNMAEVETRRKPVFEFGPAPARISSNTARDTQRPVECSPLAAQELKDSPEFAVLKPRRRSQSLQPRAADLPGHNTKDIRKTTSSRGSAWRTTGAPAITTRCEPCAIPKSSDVPTPSRAS